jgi:hypothetical protein
MPKNQIHQQNIANKSIIPSIQDRFNLLVRSSLILGVSVIVFVAAIYYGIINP